MQEQGDKMKLDWNQQFDFLAEFTELEIICLWIMYLVGLTLKECYSRGRSRGT